MITVDDRPVTPYAGELFVRLATQGRLRLTPEVGARVVRELQDTLAEVRRREAGLPRTPGLDGRCEEAVEVTFADLPTPVPLDEIAAELGRYIEAIRLASGLKIV